MMPDARNSSVAPCMIAALSAGMRFAEASLIPLSVSSSVIAPLRVRSVVTPLLHETRITIALAGHLHPSRELPRRCQQQAVAQMGRVVAVLLKAGDRDLLVVRIVLKPACGEGDVGW